MKLEPKPLNEVTKYPEKPKDEWYRKEISLKDGTKFTVFSKTYNNLLIDVVIIQKDDVCSLGGRIFTKEGEIKFNTFNRVKPRIFEGKNSLKQILAYLPSELNEMETLAENLLK